MDVRSEVKNVLTTEIVDILSKLLEHDGIFTSTGERVVSGFIKELNSSIEKEKEPSEMDKLEAYLKENGIDYTRTTEEKLGFGMWDQIKSGNWDVVCHKYSYGGDEGLLESYGMVEDCGDVTGYMTAADVIERLGAA